MQSSDSEEKDSRKKERIRRRVVAERKVSIRRKWEKDVISVGRDCDER